ncbi:MAG: amino acid adenylation domain-containing protein [Proteobacteria bacterium]|nr:amino acid adenylation domain-containing protein [Pseudomonadota bacterium]
MLINDIAKGEIEILDLLQLDKGAIEEKLTGISRDDKETAFDLEFGPLVRFKIIHTGPRSTMVLISAHHIICDGWSLDVLLKEIGTFYSSLKNNESPSPIIPYQFSQYALNLSLPSTVGLHASSMAYWKSSFRKPAQNLELPYDNNRGSTRTYDSGYCSRVISADVVNKLTEISNKTGISTFALMFAAFNILLYRLSNQSDIVVAVPFAGQPIVGKDELIGHCVNLLPIRSTVRGTDKAIDYCKLVQRSIIEAHENHHCTYGSLIRELKITRAANKMPLVSIGFTNSRMYKTGELKFKDLIPDYELEPRSFETFDLYMNAREHHGVTELRCQFNNHLFDEASIKNRLAEFEMLLDGIGTNPETLIQFIDLISQSEKNELTAINNETSTEIPEILLHDLFVEQCAVSPDALAIEFENQQVTYQQLDERSTIIAALLIEKGVQPNDFIGIYLDRSIEFIICILAVLKSGAAFLPLDPDFPAQRIEYMLTNSQAPILITDSELSSDISTMSNERLLITDSLWLNKNERESEIRQPDLSNRDQEKSAYILYTSGSTGKPKGVQISHLAVVNFISSMIRQFPMSKNDNLLAVTTFSFDISLLEIFLPLSTGAKITLAGKRETIDGGKLCKLIREKAITFLQATPTTWRMILFSQPPDLKSLTALCGGEAMPIDLKNDLVGKVKSLWNMFGPTETTIWSSSYEIKDKNSPVLIGKPIDNTRLLILDGSLQPVARGVTGDLYIGGAGLSLGYLELPELTDENFIICPFSKDHKTKIYKTGDLARIAKCGNYQHMGRVGSQVKINGFRIELGEIETLLSTHDGIRESVCTLWEKSDFDKQLVAFYRSEHSEEIPGLGEYLQKSLPDYMVPKHFIQIDKIPLTPNGKVDRKKLPTTFDGQEPDSGSNYAAPQNDFELILVNIWKRVLGLKRVGTKDNFFELGGHSISAIILIQEIEKAVDIIIDFGMIFNSPTIRQLVESIESKERIKESILVPLQSDGDGIPLFCICGIHLYQELAIQIGKQHPVFGIYVAEEQKLLEKALNRESSNISVKEIAEVYCKIIRRQQPNGPYILTGVSFGGVVCFEAAKILQAEGEEVKMIILLDAILRKGIVRNWGKWVLYHLKQIYQKGPLYYSQQVSARLPGKIPKLINKINPSEDKNPTPENDREAARFRDEAYRKAICKHESKMKPYFGDAILVRAQDKSNWSNYSSFRADYGWGNLIKGKLLIKDNPGDHLGILKSPYVNNLAKMLKPYLM